LGKAQFSIRLVERLQGKNGLPVGIDRIERHWGLPLSVGARSTMSSVRQFAIRFLRYLYILTGDG
jgi:hypothetical protein